tara:strand:+ start:203 stop:373 length:171 start_codon:yes stop_codon:yes gene_type:complete
MMPPVHAALSLCEMAMTKRNYGLPQDITPDLKLEDGTQHDAATDILRQRKNAVSED